MNSQPTITRFFGTCADGPIRSRSTGAALALLSAFSLACHGPAASGSLASPTGSVDELLAADRGYAAAAAQKDLAAAYAAMFRSDVALFAPGRGPTLDIREAVDALASDSAAHGAHGTWVPVRAGISGDGTQGFTAGYVTMRRASGSAASQKYLSYWIKGDDGWKVAVFKRGRRAADAAPMAPMSAFIPAQAAVGDRTRIEEFRRSLDAAERAFSDDAQAIGLARAFEKHGDPEAMNMGGAASGGFVVGPANIGKVVGVDEPTTGSSVRWAPDRVIVAPSGDFGVTIGTIRVNDTSKVSFPFCTVWRRAGSAGRWLYIAE